MNKTELIKNRIIELGYDCWTTDEDFVLLKNGFIKTLPINNTLALSGGICPLSIDMIAKLCVDQHQTAKDIKEGKYDNFIGKTTKQMFNDIIKNN